MGWMESQIKTRARLDDELNSRAFAELASSVSADGSFAIPAVEDSEQADAAARACLAHIGVEPGKVPDSVKELDDRIDWMCRGSGTMRRTVRLDGNWYESAFGAMLGRLDTGEVVALLPRSLRGYYYLEPETSRKVVVTREVAKHIESDALLFYMPLPAKPLKLHDFIAFIFRVFDRGDYLLVFVAALVATLIGLLPAWANKVAYGTVVPSGRASLVAPIGALLVGVAVSTALISACRNLVMSRVATKLDTVSSAATFARVLTLPSSFFKQYSSGNLASRVQSMNSLAQLLVSVILGSSLSALLSLLYVIQIGAFAPSLAVPALIIVLIQAAMAVITTVASYRFEREAMQASATLSGTVTALLNGIQKIKLAGAEERAFAKWAHGYADYARPTYNRPPLMRALSALVALVGLLGGISIYFLAGTMHIQMSDYMAFSVAFGQVTGAIMALTGVASQLMRIRPMLEMVSPILDTTPETSEDQPSIETLSGGIEVSNVSFRYDDHSPYVLNNLSFRVRKGEYVAIVGKSGCGKSTIMRLLLGFETPERGTILYGPNDVSKINLRSLRQHIGVVTQNGKLFMGDLFSNITISTPTATIDDAWEAAEIAGIADDIRRMPMGMQTLVTEGGGGISGGQRQRIMIARAICGKRRILMLDEATSALDNITQKHVADALEELRCTRIVIAHRLSTVRHCDRILVVDGGHIAEEGTYEELITKDGIFAELVERQRLDKDA